MVLYCEEKTESENILKLNTSEQQQKNKQSDSKSAVCLTAPAKFFYNEAECYVWRTTTKSHTILRSAVADECVTVILSPFPGRAPTVVFSPFDRPWDGDPSHSDASAYVVPIPLSWLPQPCTYNLQKTVPRTGKYESLHFTMAHNSVRFSSFMGALERAGFTEETSLLSTKWSLKWSKHALRSDFAHLRPFQRISRFPGTWRLGKKDHLHRNLLDGQKRWSQSKKNGNKALDDDCGEMSSFGDFFPDGWVFPDDEKKLRTVLSSPEERGNLFIVKPTLEACGRGIYLLKADENLNFLSALPHSDVALQTNAKSPRCIVQRYVHDPLLIKGYKFDLRLYVVVTSYAPFRIFLYDEGLVRFATSPYSLSEKKSTNDVKCIYNLTAHLTNFSLNKKSEDFVLPNESNGHNNNNNNDDDNGGGTGASKWTLTELKEYFCSVGLDWEGTMARIHDLLVKTFLVVEPHVCGEMNAIGGCIDKCCFELYGVDVLLRQPNPSLDPIPTPILMEVNTMPSLSTHYSLLDQCVKGNFIADMLTLVGITAAGKDCRREKLPVLTSELRTNNQSTFSYGHPFLDALTDVVELDACLKAEEELLRCRHFKRLCPTAKSYTRYCALFSAFTGVADKQRSLNELLSLWEQAKIDTQPTYYT